MTVEHIHLAPKVIQSRDLALQLYIAVSNRYGKSKKASQVFLRLTQAFDRAQDAMASAYLNEQPRTELLERPDIYREVLADRSVLIESIIKGSMRSRQPPFDGHEHFVASRALSKIARTSDRCFEKFVPEPQQKSEVAKRISKVRQVIELARDQIDDLEIRERD